MVPVALAFAYTLVSPTLAYRVNVHAEGFLTPILRQGTLESEVRYEYTVGARGSQTTVEFKASGATATWNGAKLPVNEAMTAQLFPPKRLTVGPNGSLSAVGNRPTGMLSVPFADELPARVLVPVSVPADLQLGSTWADSSGGLTLQARVVDQLPSTFPRVAMGVEGSVVVLLTLSGNVVEADRTRKLSGEGYALLDRDLGVNAVLYLDLSLAPSQVGGDSARARIQAVLDVPREPKAKPAMTPQAPWDRIAAWAGDALRWTQSQIGAARGWWSLVESLLANSLGGWFDVRPWLDGLAGSVLRKPG